ncbi:MAG TPA: cyclase family protein [Solirubrobacteraceae bacterium]|nr:cyclase family protein [Solirubrobacteraceae bacterium]
MREPAHSLGESRERPVERDSRLRNGMRDDRAEAWDERARLGRERGAVTARWPNGQRSTARRSQRAVTRRCHRALRHMTMLLRWWMDAAVRIDLQTTVPRRLEHRSGTLGPQMPGSLPELVRAATVIDLTYRLSPSFPLFPIYNPVRVADRFSRSRDGYFVRSWSFDEHCGTHVDAPAHFGEGAATVDRIPPEELLLAVAVVDIRERVQRDHDAVLLPDDVLHWERRHGELPEHAALFALTGWGRRAPDAAAYLNADSSGVLHTPGFSADATEFLKSERPQVRAIGLDASSLDIGASTDYPAHASWLPSGRYGIENLANLEQVPPAGALVVVGVPPYEGGSGGPARVLALAS